MNMRHDIGVSIGPTAVGFRAKAERQLRGQIPSVEIKIGADLRRLHAEMLAERKRQEANAINLRVRVDRNSISKANNELRRIEHTWSASPFTKMIRVQLMVAGASSMPGLIQGLMSLTAAVTELGRAALVLPGVFSGIAATVGTTATGIRGLADAFKAAGENTENTAQKARQFRDASRDLERAQRGVVQALKEANRAIEDQRDKLTRNQLSVEQAQLNVQKANQRLTQGGFESVIEYRQALIDQRQAYLDLGETIKQSKRDIQDYHEEGRKGAVQSDTFKDAMDRLSGAMDDFAKRQSAVTGFGEKFLEALSKLSPSAQDFVKQVLKLKGSWTELQNSVQQRIFDGLGDSITEVANKRLPLLRKGMEQVAQSVNLDFKQIIATLGSDKNASGISKIFEKTAQSLQLMRPGIDSLITGFIHLSEVGSRFLPRLSNAFNSLMGRFEAFIDKADKDGSLQRWIDTGLKTVTALGRGLRDLGSIFGSITKAYNDATGNVGGLVTTIANKLAEISERLASTNGQRNMRSFIHEAREFINNIKPYLDGIWKIFQAISSAAREFAETVFPFFSGLGNLLERHAWLVNRIFLLWAGFRTLGPLFSVVKKFWGGLNTGVEAYRRKVEEAAASAKSLAAQEKAAAEAATERRKKLVAIRDEEKKKVDSSQSALLQARGVETQERQKMANAKAQRDRDRREVELGRENVRAAMARLDVQSKELTAAGFITGPNGEMIADPNVTPGQIKSQIQNARKESARQIRELVAERKSLRASRSKINSDLAKIAPDIEGRLGPKGGLPADLRRQLTPDQREGVRQQIGTGRYIDREIKANAERLKQERASLRALQSARPELERDRAFADVMEQEKRLAELQRESAKSTDAYSRSTVDHHKALTQVKDTTEAVTAAKENYRLSSDLTNQAIDDETKLNARATEAQNKANAATDRATTARSKMLGGSKKLSDSIAATTTESNKATTSLGSVATAATKADKSATQLGMAIDKTKTKMQSLGQSIGMGLRSGSGLIGRLGGLMGVLGTVKSTIIGFGVGAGLLYALDKLAEAHQKAGDAARYQQDMTEALKNGLDQTTGAVTAATTAEAIDRGREFQMRGNNNNMITANVSDKAADLNIDPQLLRLAINPQQLDAIAKVEQIAENNILNALRSGKDPNWERHKDRLTEKGITDVVYAKALRGDQESVDKFNKAVESIHDEINLFPDTPGSRQLIELTGGLPNLGRSVEALAPSVPGLAVGQFQSSTLQAARAGGETAKRDNIDAKFRQGNPFGNIENPEWAPDGSYVGFDINLGTDPAAMQRKAQLEGIGVQFVPTDVPGKYVAQISGSLVDQWVMPRGMARGGSVWGAGNATSDSIPAMLSNGEFVINASSAKLIGHDNLHKLNAIRGFDQGGLVDQPWYENAKKALDAAGYTQTGGIVPPVSLSPPAVGPSPTTPGSIMPGSATAGGDGPSSARPLDRFSTVVPDAITAIAADAYSPKIPILNQPKPISSAHDGGGFKPGPDGPASGAGKPPYPTTQGPQPHEGTGVTPGSPPMAPGVIPTYEQLPGAGQSPYPKPAAPPGPGVPPPPMAAATPSMSGPYGRIVGSGVPYGLPRGTNTGGYGQSTDAFPPWVYELGNRFGVKPSTYPGHQEGSGSNRGIDWVSSFPAGSPQAIAQMEEFAKALVRDSPAGLEQVIFENPLTGTRIGKDPGDRGANQTIDDYYRDDWSGHQDHVHTRFSQGVAFDSSLPPGAAIPTIPDYSQAVPGAPVPGSISSGASIPGINAPIPGPFGPIPLEPMNILKTIGEAFINAILGFFGIDGSSIINLINGIFNGIPQQQNQAPTDASIATPEGANPNPNIAPGPDQNIIQGLVSQANDAKAAGNEQLARELLKRAQEYQTQALAASAPPSTLGSLRMDSPPADVAKAILSEARSRGYTKEQAQAILSTAIQESGGLNPAAVSPNGAWKGIFQQDASYAGRDDPNQNISAFFEGLAQRGGPGSPDIWKAIMWLQQRPSDPSADEAYRLGRKEYLSEIKNPNNLSAAQQYMQQFGYAKGGVVGLKNGGLPFEPINPQDWIDDWEDSYGPLIAVPRPDGSVWAVDPMENAGGGFIRGPGNATSDSIPAMLSDGEFVMRAAAVKHWGVNRLSAMNSLRAYAPGGPVNIDPNKPVIDPPAPPPPGPPPPAPPAPPGTPPAQPPSMAGTPTPPPPQDLSQVPYLGKEMMDAANGIAGSLMAPKRASSGGSPGAPQPKSIDPRSTMAPAPTSSQHIHPALAATISAPIGLIGSAVGQAASTAASVGAAAALAGGTMGAGAALAPLAAPMAGQAAGQLAQFGTQVANDVLVGAGNILSSLFVGTVTPSQTGQGYGAPLIPPPTPPVNNFQNIHNGNIVTNDLPEYSRLQDRKMAQRSAPFFNRVGF